MGEKISLSGASSLALCLFLGWGIGPLCMFSGNVYVHGRKDQALTAESLGNPLDQASDIWIFPGTPESLEVLACQVVMLSIAGFKLSRKFSFVST